MSFGDDVAVETKFENELKGMVYKNLVWKKMYFWY